MQTKAEKNEIKMFILLYLCMCMLFQKRPLSENLLRKKINKFNKDKLLTFRLTMFILLKNVEKSSDIGEEHKKNTVNVVLLSRKTVTFSTLHDFVPLSN